MSYETTEKVWRLKSVDIAATRQIENDLNIHPALCRLLALRGIKDFDTSKHFFRPELTDLHDPFLMKGMDKAVDRIVKAQTKGEKIMVYGDYDVDGTTAVALMYSFLQNNYHQDKTLLSYYIPNRYREGYGISYAGIDKAKADNCSVIIALDCGIKAIDKAAYAKSIGIDLIICDHHLPSKHLPDAYAILNPKQEECSYPYKELSGCGIGFKFITALTKYWQLPKENYYRYLDLVATSIAADIVPLTGENRIMAYYGIKRTNENPCFAIKALKEIAAVQRDMNIADLVFIIAPRINAAGRMGDAGKAVALFISEDIDTARELALQLQADNIDRREADKQTTEEALAMLHVDDTTKYSTVVYQPHWHKGVVGIVASRLTEYYYRPTIVLTSSNGSITGSARSVVGFSIYDAINACSDLLQNFGGHNFAAGITLHPDNLEAFRIRFEEVVRNTIQPDSLQPIINIDAEISLSDITQGFYNIIKQFEPFGPENLRPVFISKGVADTKQFSRIVKELHVKFALQQHKTYISGIGFNLANKIDLLANGNKVDIVYTIDENEWNGQKSLQIQVLDIRRHQS